MQFDNECAACLRRSQLRMVGGDECDPKVRAFMADVDAVIRTAPAGVSAPYCVPGFAAALKKHFGIDDYYAQIKKDSDEKALSLLPQARAIVEAAEDPLEMALKFSRTGNFFDFAVLSSEQIRRELPAAITSTPEQVLEPGEYAGFRDELLRAKEMLILGDNAGEIAFDTLLVEQIQKLRPDLLLRYVVRGGNAQNDATRQDAAAVGMDRLVPILDNGSAIPATEPDYCSDELRSAMENADLILSKGQANLEALIGRGYPVYYAFLCKCGRLSRILGLPPLTGVFCHESRLARRDL